MCRFVCLKRTLLFVCTTRHKDEVGFTCMCPGYCATAMSSHKGTRTAADGARTATWLALHEDEAVFRSGLFFADGAVREW